MPSDDFNEDDDELFKQFSSRGDENYKGTDLMMMKLKPPFGDEGSHEERK